MEHRIAFMGYKYTIHITHTRTQHAFHYARIFHVALFRSMSLSDCHGMSCVRVCVRENVVVVVVICLLNSFFFSSLLFVGNIRLEQVVCLLSNLFACNPPIFSSRLAFVASRSTHHVYNNISFVIHLVLVCVCVCLWVFFFFSLTSHRTFANKFPFEQPKSSPFLVNNKSGRHNNANGVWYISETWAASAAAEQNASTMFNQLFHSPILYCVYAILHLWLNGEMLMA